MAESPGGLGGPGAAPEFVVRQTALPGLTLIAAHTARCFARHTHATHGIGVIDAGGQRSASGRGPVEAVRGQLITVNPGEVHDGLPLGREKRRWRMAHLDRVLVQDEQNERGGETHVEWTQPVLHDARLRGLLGALFACAAHGGDALALEAHLTMLMHHAPTTGAVPHVRARGAGRALARARERLADTQMPWPSLAELARDAGLSRYQFLRAFATEYGLPPAAWAGQQRLARAERALARGVALAEAAAASGFADQSHMTRAFRRFRGYTPGAWAAAQG